MSAERRQHGRDLAARVLAAARPELARRRARTWRRRAVVAAFGAALCGALLLAVRLGAWTADRDWIAERLQADGRFDPRSWTGPAGSEPGLQGLALLALARADESTFRPRLDELRRGADRLLEQQARAGLSGVPAAGPEDALATLALLEVYARTGDGELRRGARAAVERLAERSRPGRSAWELAALLRADALGLSTRLAGPIARARRELGVTTGTATRADLERAALVELGPLAQDGFGALPSSAAVLLATLPAGR
jgi:hypothetical protein